MKRDMELVRDILIQIEGNPILDGLRWVHFDKAEEVCTTGNSYKEVAYHLTLLVEAGLVKGKSGIEEMPVVTKLTWQGHEFIDNIRDKDIWHRTKERIKGLPTVAMSVIVEVAKAEIKAKLGLP
jgi:hypothetical protein